MKDAGYIYVNIDDTWELDRDAKGNIRTNSKFPDIEGASRLRPRQGLEAWNLLFAGTVYLRRL